MMDVKEKSSNGKRMIDADKLLEIYKKWIPQLLSKEDEGDRRGVETCIAVLEDMQTVDSVPVVRCQECVGRPFWEEDHNGVPVCLLSGLYVRSEDDFCSYGERKDGDSDG